MAFLGAILCPIDFSDSSRAALCYAAAIADHVGARLTVMSVDDPLLANVVAMSGQVPSLAMETERELHHFVDQTFTRGDSGKIGFHNTVGKAAPEILRAAAELHVDLIVMSSHGRSGLSKQFFGSTTERVLRETTVPVLVTPGERPSSHVLKELQIYRVLCPVDLTAGSLHQLGVAAGVAAALSARLITAHVIEPAFVPASIRHVLAGVDATRRADAEDRLNAVISAAAPGIPVETVIVSGDSSEEIVKLAQTRDARLIVMGLHSSGMLGPRMGSVTYRVLCKAHRLVLALPPAPRP